MKKFFAVALVTLALSLASAFAQTTTYRSTSEGFKITSPVVLETQPTQQGTTDNGTNYMYHTAAGRNQNGVYIVMVGDYPFQTVKEDLDRAINRILLNPAAKLVSRDNLTVSSAPAARVVVDVTADDGSITRVISLFVVAKNHLYDIMFGFDPNTTPDAAEVNAYFASFELSQCMLPEGCKEQ